MRLRVLTESAVGHSRQYERSGTCFARILKYDDGASYPVTDPDAVARALSRLATDSAQSYGVDSARIAGRPESNVTGPREVIDDAEAAMKQVDRAAAFLDAGGEAQLRQAVQIADARAESSLASRGRELLTALSAFRSAANGSSPAGTASAGSLPPRSHNALPRGSRSQ